MTDQFDQLRVALAGRYTIEREIGSGGMANVYLARDLRHWRKVAVKVLRPELAVSIGLERFLQEIEITARLTHPHILPLLDSGKAGEFPYYVMPYSEGESLHDRLQRERQLPLQEAVRVASDIAQALSYAHSLGVVHRDIKPANIFLAGDHAMVADFGVARALTAAGEKRLTDSGIAVGTPAYMSPEQGTADAAVDPRSDIYSLGCVLYEMLTGGPPFTGPTAQAIIARHVSEPPSPMRIVRPTISLGLEHIVHTTLAKIPADRYSTATHLIEALSEPMLGKITDPSQRHPIRSLSRTGLRRAVATVAAVALVLSAAAVTLWRMLDGADQRSRVQLLVMPFSETRGVLEAGGVQAAELQGHFIQSLGWITEFSVLDGGAGPEVDSEQPSFDLQRALELGESLEAAYLITGDLIAVDGEPQLTITLREVTTGRVVSQSIGGSARESVTKAAGRLALQVVGTLADQEDLDPGPGARLASATTSPEAVRYILDGQHRFLVENSDAAVPEFRRAVEADSTLAEAYFWLSMAESWAPRWDYATALEVIEAGLARRDQMASRRVQLLEAQGYYVRRMADSAIAAFEAVTQIYPQIAEAWFGLGEALYHFAGFAGRDRLEAQIAFERALAADSGFAPFHSHLTELALHYGDEERARRYMPLVAGDDRTRGFYSNALTLRAGTAAEREALLHSLPSADFRSLAFLIVHFCRAGNNLPLADTLTGFLLRPERALDDRRRGAQYRLAIRAGMGRWDEGLAVWDSVVGGGRFDRWMAQAFLAGFPAGESGTSVLAIAEAQISGGVIPDFTLRIESEPRQAFRAVVHDAMLHADSTEIQLLLNQIARAARLADHSDPFPMTLRTSLMSRLALLAADTTAAIRALERATSHVLEPYVANYPLTTMAPQRLLLADLHIRVGNARLAQRWIDSFSQTSSVGDVLYLQRVRELQDRIGSKTGASEN